jgi:hypothetical protein
VCGGDTLLGPEGSGPVPVLGGGFWCLGAGSLVVAVPALTVVGVCGGHGCRRGWLLVENCTVDASIFVAC